MFLLIFLLYAHSGEVKGPVTDMHVTAESCSPLFSAGEEKLYFLL